MCPCLTARQQNLVQRHEEQFLWLRIVIEMTKHKIQQNLQQHQRHNRLCIFAYSEAESRKSSLVGNLPQLNRNKVEGAEEHSGWHSFNTI